MPNPLIIDCHLHMYESQDLALWEKDNYEIWEYGDKAEVHSGRFAGDVGDALKALSQAGAAKAVAVNLFGLSPARQQAIAELPEGLTPTEEGREIERIDESMGDRLKSFNEWACGVAKEHPEFVPFVAADPWVLPVEEMCDHIVDQVRHGGAKGIKLHGIIQQVHMSDRRMWPIYQTCVEEGISIIAHSGPARGPDQYAEPRAFADVLKAFPDLVLVLAHLGGGAWGQIRECADAFPQAYFDCSEILAWTGGTKAPSNLELARLIKEIGPHRVMMGSDFPWYDVDYSADWVMSLPVLSQSEKEGIVGANAERILRL